MPSEQLFAMSLSHHSSLNKLIDDGPVDAARVESINARRPVR